MMEMHVKREDLEIEWLDESAFGAPSLGCRVIHKASGMKAESAMFSNRDENRQTALYVLAARMVATGADRVVMDASGAELIVAGTVLG